MALSRRLSSLARVVRSTVNSPSVTDPSATVRVPVTSLVRPLAVTRRDPAANTSSTRYPATVASSPEPAATDHGPSSSATSIAPPPFVPSEPDGLSDSSRGGSEVSRVK